MIILNRRFATPLLEFYKLMVAYHTMVEHSAVNRVVVGSSPTRGAAAIAAKARKHQRLRAFCCLKIFCKKQKKANARKKQAGKC